MDDLYPEWEKYLSEEEFANLKDLHKNATSRLLRTLQKVHNNHNFHDYKRTVEIVPLQIIDIQESDQFLKKVQRTFLRFVEESLLKYNLKININEDSKEAKLFFIKENLKLFPLSLKKEIIDILSVYPKLFDKQDEAKEVVGYMRVSNTFYDWVTCSTSKYFGSCASFVHQTGYARNNALFYYLAKYHYVVKIFKTKEDAELNGDNFTNRFIITDNGEGQAIHRVYGSGLPNLLGTSPNTVKVILGLNLGYDVIKEEKPLKVHAPIESVPNIYIDIAKGDYASYVYSNNKAYMESVIQSSFNGARKLLRGNL